MLTDGQDLAAGDWERELVQLPSLRVLLMLVGLR
jgi:hypothetical protein